MLGSVTRACVTHTCLSCYVLEGGRTGVGAGTRLSLFPHRLVKFTADDVAAALAGGSVKPGASRSGGTWALGKGMASTRSALLSRIRRTYAERLR